MQASHCKRHLYYTNLHPSIIQWFPLSHFIMFSQKASHSASLGANPGRSSLVHRCGHRSCRGEQDHRQWPWKCRPAVTIPRSLDLCAPFILKACGQHRLFIFVLEQADIKRLISLKFTNYDQIILQTTNTNIFSRVPSGDVIVTFNLNNNSIYPSVGIFLWLTHYLEASATNRFREILFMRVTELHLWATH